MCPYLQTEWHTTHYLTLVVCVSPSTLTAGATVIEVALVDNVCPHEGQSKQLAHLFFFNLASALGIFSKQFGQ